MWNKDEINRRSFNELDQARELVEFKDERNDLFEADCWGKSDDH